MELNLKKVKIASSDINNIPYLRSVARQKWAVILSTGMSNIGEIEKAKTTLVNNGIKDRSLTILHCNTAYPTPYTDVNLNALKTLETAFPSVDIGLSDHTLGVEVPIAAVALGAKVIEKHLTINRSFQGPDHAASSEPHEFKSMVESIRNVEKALGT